MRWGEAGCREWLCCIVQKVLHEIRLTWHLFEGTVVETCVSQSIICFTEAVVWHIRSKKEITCFSANLSLYNWHSEALSVRLCIKQGGKEKTQADLGFHQTPWREIENYLQLRAAINFWFHPSCCIKCDILKKNYLIHIPPTSNIPEVCFNLPYIKRYTFCFFSSFIFNT